MPDYADLDTLFSCPVDDEDLVALYEALRQRLLKETEAIEVSTASLIRGSLLLNWTVKHQRTTRLQYADIGGYANPGQEKDAIMALESILKDWDDIMLKSRPKDSSVEIKRLIEDVKAALSSVIGALEDEEQRVTLMAKFAKAFAQIGI